MAEDKIKTVVRKVQSLPAAVAGDVWPGGATMACKVCGARQHLTTEECGRCLFGAGWPQHCGQTMIMLSDGEEGGS